MSPLSMPQRSLVYTVARNLLGRAIDYPEHDALVALASSGKDLSWAEKDMLIKGIKEMERLSYMKEMPGRGSPEGPMAEAKRLALGVAAAHGFVPGAADAGTESPIE